MSKEKCKVEKDREQGLWNELLEAGNESFAAWGIRERFCQNASDSCQPQIFEGAKGERLRLALNGCRWYTMACADARRDVEEANRKIAQKYEKWKVAEKALSDCEHKKKKGKK